MESLLRRKAVGLDALPDHHRLKPTLSWWHLIPLGVGAIVGTGIYALIGVGVNLAGPAITSAGLSKRFRGGQLAVDGVDLEVPRGAIFALLGDANEEE